MNFKTIFKYLLIAALILILYLGYSFIMNFVFPSDNRQAQLNSYEYPEAFKLSFINTCLPTANEALCKCALEFYESKYTYGEYVKIGSNEEIKAEMRKHCLAE